MISPGDRPWALLEFYIRLALSGYRPEVAQLALQALDTDHYRLLSHARPGPDGEIDPDTLSLQVDLECEDGWAPIVRVHHSRLGLSWPEVLAEVECLKWQNGIVPDDIRELTDSPDRPGSA